MTTREKLLAEMETIQRRWTEIQAELAQLDQAEHNQAHTHLYADWLKRDQAWLGQQQAQAQDINSEQSAAALAIYQQQQQQLADRAEIDRQARLMFPGVRR